MARNQVTANSTGDLMMLALQNLVRQDNLTLLVGLPFKIGNWWDMNYHITGGWRRFNLDYTALPVEKIYFTYSASVNHAVKLHRDFLMEISGWYNALSYDGSKKIKGFGSANMGLKKTLKQNWGNVQLSVVNIFKTMNLKSYYGALTREAFNLNSEVTYVPESGKSRIFKVTYSRNFGGTRATSRSNGSTSDENDRIR
nr:outer membrane beta-barrel protein [Olivibacter sitiensis]